VKAVLGRRDEAVEMLQRVLAGCGGREPQALLQLGAVQEQRGQPREAAEALDRLDRDYPATAQGKEAEVRLRKLSASLPPATPEEKMGRDLKKALVPLRGRRASRRGEAVPGAAPAESPSPRTRASSAFASAGH
jgi:hypothetical protein